MRQYPATARRLSLFLMASGMATVFAIALRGALAHALPFEVAVIAAHLCGTLVAFALHRLFVFETYAGSLLRAYLRFLVVNIGSAVLTLVISSLAYRLYLEHSALPKPDYLAHVLGLALAAAPAYLGHALFSFRKHEAASLAGSAAAPAPSASVASP